MFALRLTEVCVSCVLCIIAADSCAYFGGDINPFDKCVVSCTVVDLVQVSSALVPCDLVLLQTGQAKHGERHH